MNGASSDARERPSAPLSEGAVIGAPRRWTSLTLSTGVLLSALCFLVAGVAELAGVAPGGGDMTDAAALVRGLVVLTPWAWAGLGTLIVVATPAVGLIVTGAEYASVADHRTVALALAVLLVLAGGALIALGR